MVLVTISTVVPIIDPRLGLVPYKGLLLRDIFTPYYALTTTMEILLSYHLKRNIYSTESHILIGYCIMEGLRAFGVSFTVIFS